MHAYLYHVKDVSSCQLNVKVTEDNTVWQWRPHFWANKRTQTFL